MILFDNIGNSCYLNSVLQLLLNQIPFSYFFKHVVTTNQTPRIVKIFEILIEVKTKAYGTQSVANPRIIKDELAKSGVIGEYIFGNRNQQDAHEAVVSILDIVHEATRNPQLFENAVNNYSRDMTDAAIQASFKAWKETSKTFGYSFITEYFTGQIRAQTICKNCNHQTIKYENFNNLMLQIPHSGASIIDCFRNYVTYEPMHDYKCDKCSERDTTKKKTTIWKFPPVMIIAFKRFIGNRRLNFQVELEELIEFKSNEIIYKYDMTTAVFHHGSSPHGGHYTALTRGDDKKWYTVDDETAYQTLFPKLSSNIYLASYYIKGVT